MLMELIATAVLGLAVAGIVLAVSRFSGQRLPRSAAPLAAGAAMIAFQVWSEYAWFDRTRSALPEGMQVTASYEEAVPWRPWTYLAPQVTRFAAVDVLAARRHDKHPDQVMANVLLFTRFAPTRSVPQLVDCKGQRRAVLIDGVTFGTDGAVLNPDWRDVEGDDPLLGALCAAPAG